MSKSSSPYELPDIGQILARFRDRKNVDTPTRKQCCIWPMWRCLLEAGEVCSVLSP